jgi:hypothetical protein
MVGCQFQSQWLGGREVDGRVSLGSFPVYAELEVMGMFVHGQIQLVDTVVFFKCWREFQIRMKAVHMVVVLVRSVLVWSQMSRISSAYCGR